MKDTVIQLEPIRQQKRIEKQRKNERLLLQNFIGLFYTHALPVKLIEISEEGLAFISQHPMDVKNLSMRLYCHQSSYIELPVIIKNSHPWIDSSVRAIRYGCLVDQTAPEYSAYLQFVRFMKLYSQHCKSTLA